MNIGAIHLDLSHVEQPRHELTAEHLEIIIARGCIKCGAQVAPEPTDEERKRLFDDPDFTWERPPGVYLETGFGIAFGGYGPYACCDGCGEVYKVDLGPEAE